jgi:hypothetical protein
MHFLAVLIELSLQIGNDLRRRAPFIHFETHLWEGADCAFSLYRVPFNVADVPLWRIHGRAGMRKLYHATYAR